MSCNHPQTHVEAEQVRETIVALAAKPNDVRIRGKSPIGGEIDGPGIRFKLRATVYLSAQLKARPEWEHHAMADHDEKLTFRLGCC
jgi:hypothetical protein